MKMRGSEEKINSQWSQLIRNLIKRADSEDLKKILELFLKSGPHAAKNTPIADVLELKSNKDENQRYLFTVTKD